MKTYHLIALLLLLCSQSFSQAKYKTATNELPKNVINDFAKAVNYSWYYANNTDAFKGALIPGLQQRGITAPFDIERTIQDVGKSKSCRDLVLRALYDYTGFGRLNEILRNMDIPANSARILTAYVYRIQQPNQNAAIVLDKPITKTNIILIKSPADLDPLLRDSSVFIKDNLASPAGPLTYGIITDVKNDNQNSPSEIMIYFKDKQNPKGIYKDVFLEDFGSSMTPEKLILLKKNLVRGRKVSFKTYWVGSSAGYDVLAYLKAFPKNTVLLRNND